VPYEVGAGEHGDRLDVFATAQIGKVSRAFVGKLCEQGKVLVNGKVETKAGYKLRAGDEVTVDYDFAELEKIPDIDLPVLYEDDDCLVVNKPVGVLSHSKGAFNPEGTVATFVRDKVRDMDGDRAGIVHRLDRATSGVMIVAKHPEALSWLQKQFSQRKVKKTYYAVIAGTLKEERAIIDMPIERNPKEPKTFRVGTHGKPATTQYEVAKTNGTHSLVKLQPQTGRTHQLRVHLKQLGHPIVGDTFYEGEKAERLYLHAETLEITIPSHERKVFHAPLPPEFRAILKT
jgi:23S rRNA pseudouridine1911/1915/1917 synthase